MRVVCLSTAVAHEREVEGDLFLQGMGEGSLMRESCIVLSRCVSVSGHVGDVPLTGMMWFTPER